MSDDEKQLARNARTVQSLQLKLVAGMVAGFLVGCLIAAYVILPMGGMAVIVAVFFPFVAALIGQHLVLMSLTS